MSDGVQARTVCNPGIYQTAEAFEAFAMHSEALYIWMFAMMRANTGWIFRKAHVMRNYVGCGDRKWKESIKFLISLGLLEIKFVRTKTGQVKGKEYVFYGWDNRLMESEIRCDKQIQSSTTKHDKKSSQKLINPNKNEPSTEGDILPCSAECNHLIYQLRGYGGSEGVCDDMEDGMEPELAEGHRSRFMRRFAGNNTFQVFDDSKDKNRGLARVFHNDMKLLDDLNFYGGGIFLTINETDGKGRKRENIQRVRAVFVDLDGSPLDPVLEYKPHMVVETSPEKYHAYWFVKDFPLEAFSATQKRLAEMFNGDPVVHDVSRVMRIPGYWHQKGEPFMSRIVLESYDEPLSYMEVVQKFPPKQVKQWSRPKTTTTEESDYTGPYGTGEGGRNHGLARFIGGMIRRRKSESYMEQEAYKWGKSCSPPMSDHEINSVLRSVGRYAQ